MTTYTKLPGTVTFSTANQEISKCAKEEKTRYKQFLQVIEARRRANYRSYWKKRRWHTTGNVL